MAITFLHEKKRRRYLVLVLALLVFAILVIVWQGSSRRPEAVPPLLVGPLTPKKIIINWSVLEDLKLAELRLFEQIKPFEGKIGRKNPFIPY